MSDKLREAALEGKILEIRCGSHLYGTNTPESDEDFIGIFMPPKEYVLGLQTVKEVDFSTVDKNEEGKNTAEAIDKKLYEFRKFISLALQNNPNIIEILFVNEENIIECNEIGRRLLGLRHLFPCKQASKKFLGYAKSQKHKMIIRRDHFNELREGLEILNWCDNKTTMAEVFNLGHVYTPEEQANSELIFYKKEKGHHIHCGDICFEPGVYVKKARRMLEERLSKITNRSELVLKHGYDTKFASHLIRLLTEGIEILNTGRLEFPLPNAKNILDIKDGNFSVQEILKEAETLEEKYEKALEASTLPDKPPMKEIEKFTIQEMYDWVTK